MGIYLTGFSDEICEDFQTQLDTVVKFGLRHIEMRSVGGINVADLTAAQQDAAVALLRQKNVSVSAIGSPVGKISITEEFAPHFESFQNVVELSKKVGAKYIRIFSFYIPKGERPEQYTEQVMRRMEQMVCYAQQEEVVLLHENEKGIYGDNAVRCRELMGAFYGDYFQAIFDFANFVECGVNTEEAFALLSPFICYVHIKDAQAKEKKVVPAGQGDGNVAKILGKLKKNGFSGFLSLEPHLFQFSGLQGLEQEAQRREAGNAETAWKTALDALKAILWDLGWEGGV